MPYSKIRLIIIGLLTGIRKANAGAEAVGDPLVSGPLASDPLVKRDLPNCTGRKIMLKAGLRR
jgi:hypothetical protein